jgi:serine/threonine protein kinase
MAGVLSKLKQLFGSGKRKSKDPPVDVKRRFELIGKTGQGSMSKVYRARDYKINRMVCLKLLDKTKTARFEARFPGLKKPSEGEICQLLRHRNLVQTYENGITTEGEPYIVFELIEGLGLNFLIETNSPHLKGKRINYLCQLAEGLDFIHKHGFLHRDICPRNTMVTNEGVVKIIDFGLAVPYRPEFCKPGNRTGTPDYLAPELIKRGTTDHRIDVFALGVTAFETFTGGLPWEKAHQSLQTIQSHLNSPGRNPKELKPDLDAAVVKFLLKAIERAPNARFQSAMELRDALKALPKQDY